MEACSLIRTTGGKVRTEHRLLWGDRNVHHNTELRTKRLQLYWRIDSLNTTFVSVGFHVFLIFFLYLFTYSGVQHNFHSRWCSCSLTVIRRVSHEEEKLLTLQEHLPSPSVFNGVRITRYLVFYVVVCTSVFVLLTFFCCHCVVCSSSLYALWLYIFL